MIRVAQIGVTPVYAGIENFLMNYYEKMDRNVFHFDFVSMLGPVPYEERIEALGGRLFYTDDYKRSCTRAERQLLKIFRENRYDIVHVNMSHAINLIPLRAALRCRAHPVVIGHSHNSGLSGSFMPVRKTLHNLNLRSLRRYRIEKWACSEAAGRWMWGESFDASDVIPNAVDLPRFQRNPAAGACLRQRYGFQPSDRVVGFTGRLCGQKNVEFLPEILGELRRLSPNYKMLIVGDGERRSSLSGKFQRMGLLPYVCFAGAREDAAPWYSAMDAFVLPSLFEGLPVAGIEAQAGALPCFVSERITGELNITGAVKYLPIGRGAGIWAEAIHTALLDRPGSPSAFPKEYDIARAARRLEERYLSLAADRRGKDE